MPDPTTNVICITEGRLRFVLKRKLQTEPEPEPAYKWTRSKTLALGQQGCTSCFGLGSRPGRGGKDAVCACVLRNVFTACYRKFLACSGEEVMMGKVSYEHKGNRSTKPRSIYSMRQPEFMADFVLLAFRALNDGLTRTQLSEAGLVVSRRWKLFVLHFLMGATWSKCTARLGLDRGEFFHEVYRVQAKVGRAFAEAQPYALFPLDEYFTAGFGRAQRSNAAAGVKQSEATTGQPTEQALAA